MLREKVLLTQFMKGGVNQGVANPVKLCGNLTWVRSSHSFDQYNSEEIKNNQNLNYLLINLRMNYGIFAKSYFLVRMIKSFFMKFFLLLKIIDKDDLVSTLKTDLYLEM